MPTPETRTAEDNRDVNVYPHKHMWKFVEDITLHGAAKWVACSECGELDCDYIRSLEKSLKEEKEKKEQALKTMQSVASGAIASSKRDKEAITKGLEALGLAQSMILGGEKHSHTSEATFEEAVGLLHNALRYKSPPPPSSGGVLSQSTP